MSKKTKGTIAITLAIAAMVLIFVSSSMSYKDQSLVATIQKGLPSQPFSELLSKIKFEYAGQTISIPSLGYAQFVAFFSLLFHWLPMDKRIKCSCSKERIPSISSFLYNRFIRNY